MSALVLAALAEGVDTDVIVAGIVAFTVAGGVVLASLVQPGQPTSGRPTSTSVVEADEMTDWDQWLVLPDVVRCLIVFAVLIAVDQLTGADWLTGIVGAIGIVMLLIGGDDGDPKQQRARARQQRARARQP